mmetsp:Transcript_75397/g.157152  ORF Transcript_75397/g.157152 Transcript_75397/m.157152 type:complete len:82 (-) Transcript_75397:702-947(-)
MEAQIMGRQFHLRQALCTLKETPLISALVIRLKPQSLRITATSHHHACCSNWGKQTQLIRPKSVGPLMGSRYMDLAALEVL